MMARSRQNQFRSERTRQIIRYQALDFAREHDAVRNWLEACLDELLADEAARECTSQAARRELTGGGHGLGTVDPR
jgi:hypothetical protein